MIARLAGLDGLVFHTVTPAGTPPLHQVLDHAHDLVAGRPPATVEQVRRIGS